MTIDHVPHCIAFWSKCREEHDSNSAELICIHSLCDQWHKGFGSMMMNYIFTEVKAADYNKLVLWVFEKNIRARKFYEKHGFQVTNAYKDSFGSTEVMYTKSL